VLHPPADTRKNDLHTTKLAVPYTSSGSIPSVHNISPCSRTHPFVEYLPGKRKKAKKAVLAHVCSSIHCSASNRNLTIGDSEIVSRSRANPFISGSSRPQCRERSYHVFATCVTRGECSTNTRRALSPAQHCRTDWSGTGLHQGKLSDALETEATFRRKSCSWRVFG
jgi:hypothetical protein